MNNRILLVDDDEVFRRHFKEFFERRDYSVVLACDGREGLKAIGEAQEPFGVIVLDLRMPNVSGEDMLREMESTKGVSPIIVLSGYFNRDAVDLCLHAGVKCLFGKPFDMEYIRQAVNAVMCTDDLTLWSLVDDETSGIQMVTFPRIVLFRLTRDLQRIVEAEDPVGSMVRRREAALRTFFLDQISHPAVRRVSAQEAVFVVARRWNSWYPSVFDVPGGCYALVGPSGAGNRGSCAIIDPGFRCLEVLRDLGISIHDIATFVVSHNHPDHVAGIFELMASRHALGLETTGWCNRTTMRMFGDCSGFGLEIDELSTTISSALFTHDNGEDMKRKVLVRGFPTAHREIGRSSATLGLIISCYHEDPKGDRLLGKAIVLGDTEYDRAQNQSFLDLLTDEGVRFVVLHVGSIQVKQREGGHLYYPGLKRLLTDMEAALEARERAGRKLPVLLSEWGLEHATRQQIEAVCSKDLVEFDDKSPILEMAERLNDGLRMAHVLPADIGLTIGLETGSVYLPDGSVQEADEVRVFVGAKGIEYGKAP